MAEVLDRRSALMDDRANGDRDYESRYSYRGAGGVDPTTLESA